MSVNAWDNKDSMLSSSLLESYCAFSFCFLLCLVNFLIIPVVREKIKVKLAFVIPTGAPTILVNEITDIPPLVALKTIKTLSI